MSCLRFTALQTDSVFKTESVCAVVSAQSSGHGSSLGFGVV